MDRNLVVDARECHRRQAGCSLCEFRTSSPCSPRTSAAVLCLLAQRTRVSAGSSDVLALRKFLLPRPATPQLNQQPHACKVLSGASSSVLLCFLFSNVPWKLFNESRTDPKISQVVKAGH